MFSLLVLSCSPAIAFESSNKSSHHEQGILNEKFIREFDPLGSIKKMSKNLLDEMAHAYCCNHSNTYIAIIWPRAIEKVEGMKKVLAKHVTLLYQKSFELYADGPILLYQIAHPGFFHTKLKKHIKNYIPDGTPEPYKFQAILFETDKSLSDIIQFKQEVRDFVGISYWSIHINDFYNETIDMAQLVFNDSMIRQINFTPFSE